MNKQSKRRSPRSIAWIALAAGMLGHSAGGSAQSASAADSASLTTNTTTVLTDRGFVRGSLTDDGRSFLGIPYAAPPVGSKRWKPPAGITPWLGVRDATAGSPATQ